MTKLFRLEDMAHITGNGFENLYSIRIDDKSIPGLEINFQGFLDNHRKQSQGQVAKNNHPKIEFS